MEKSAGIEELKFAKKMEFENVLGYVGGFGRYQRVLYCLLGFTSFIGPFLHLGIVFVAGGADHWCASPRLDGHNISLSERKNLTLPIEIQNGELKYSQCELYDRNYSNFDDTLLGDMLQQNNSHLKKISCPNDWEYDHSQYTRTIVMKVRKNIFMF